MVAYSHIKRLGGGPVLTVRLPDHGQLLQEEVDDLAAEWNVMADRPDCRMIVVDCSQVVVLRSQMLAKLILLQRRMKRKKGKLVLCRMRAEARQVLSWTKLDRLFEVTDDEEREAVPAV
jgi:anti-anti-sigma factor